MKITYREHEGGIPDEPRTIDVPEVYVKIKYCEYECSIPDDVGHELHAYLLDAFEAAMYERCDAENGHVADCECEQP